MAVLVDSRAEVFLWNSTAVGQSAVSALEGGEFNALGGTLEGGIFARNDAIVRLNETVKSDASDNLFFSGSTFRVFNQSSVAGNTLVEGFSKLLLQSGASLDGGLYCDDGGDAFCANADLISGPIDGCSSCGGPGPP